MGKINRDTITKILKKMGEKAREDARIHGTYIVYEDEKGNTVREYSDGRIETEKDNKNGSTK